MKIKGLSEKLVVQGLFYQTNPMGQRVARAIQIENLLDAISIKKKIIKGAEEIKDHNGVITAYNLTNDDCEFNEEEVKLLKQWLDEKATWTIEDAEIAMDLKERINNKLKADVQESKKGKETSK